MNLFNREQAMYGNDRIGLSGNAMSQYQGQAAGAAIARVKGGVESALDEVIGAIDLMEKRVEALRDRLSGVMRPQPEGPNNNAVRETTESGLAQSIRLVESRIGAMDYRLLQVLEALDL